MAVSVVHATQTVVVDDAVAGEIGPSEWNEAHTVTGAVDTATQVIAGSGLTGGGDLSANRTFDVGAGAGITVNANDVALDTTNARNVDHTAVTLTAGAGLTGGGDISANRTFTVGAGTGITVNADDVAVDTTVVTPTTRTLTAGAGLTGGGDLSANRTFDVGAGTGITVNANDVALDLTHDANALHPASSTDNAIARYDSTSGNIQNSGIFINDTNELQAPVKLAVGNVAVIGQTIISPGDLDTLTTPIYATIIINDEIDADLSVNEQNSLICLDGGVKHTGASEADFIGVDLGLFVGAASTGDFNNLVGYSANVQYYGEGDLTTHKGAAFGAQHRGNGVVEFQYGLSAGVAAIGAGSPLLRPVVEWSAGIYVAVPQVGTGGDLGEIDEYYGIYIDDPGAGPTVSYALYQNGPTAQNVLEGKLHVGARVTEAVITLTDAANVTLNSALGNVYLLVAAGNRTIDAPTNAPAAGRSQKIVIRHQASGAARTVTLAGGAGGFRFGADITGVTATDDGEVDYIGAIWNQPDGVWDIVSYVKGF